MTVKALNFTCVLSRNSNPMSTLYVSVPTIPRPGCSLKSIWHNSSVRNHQESDYFWEIQMDVTYVYETPTDLCSFTKVCYSCIFGWFQRVKSIEFSFVDLKDLVHWDFQGIQNFFFISNYTQFERLNHFSKNWKREKICVTKTTITF